jgi:aldehyde dehydrogenase (NAD+)
MAELVRPELSAAADAAGRARGACGLVASDADLPLAAARCAWAACSRAGRAGFALRRIYVEKPARAELRRLLVQNIKELRCGGPEDDADGVAPLGDEASAAALEERLKEAVASGARLWAGGPRRGALLPPALVEDVPEVSRLSIEDFAGPVALLERVDSREAALERMARFSAGGGRAGIFTNDLALVLRAFERLSVAELLVNDVSIAPGEGVRPALVARERDRALVIRS